MRKPSGYWIKENVFNESKKYISRNEFRKGCNSAYNVAHKNNWLNEMTWLKPKNLYGENAQKRDNVYAYEFKEYNSVYVGRTINLIRRNNEHICGKNNSSVHKFAKENNINVPEPKILETNITILEGQELEGIWVERYREQGWNILNKAKCGKGCGSLGTLYRKWTKNKVFEESKKYTSRSEFKYNKPSAYLVACKNNWLDEMTWLKRKHHKPYTKEEIFEESKKYTYFNDFKKNNASIFNIAFKNGWLDEMTWLKRKLHKPYTKEDCFEESKKYTSRKEFKKNCYSAWDKSNKNGWLDEMTWLKQQCKYWNIQSIKQECKKYNSKIELSKNAPGAYRFALRHNLIDILFPKK